MLFHLLNPLFIIMAITAQLMSFGKANDAELAKLSAGFAWRLRIFMFLVKVKYGLDVLIIDGLRTAAEQAVLHRQDSRNPALPGDHGDGNAADVRIYKKGIVHLTKSSPPAAWANLYRDAAFCGIANGSVFPGYPDNNHFFRRPGSSYFTSLLNLFKK